MKITRKRNKGITLVALVVTVIILLILAGISIASLTGNGLFEKAKLAKEKQESAQIIENETLSEYEEKISLYTRDENGGNSESSIEYYDLSEVDTTYNPYGIKGFVTYDNNFKKLEINFYQTENKLPSTMSNLSKIMNLGFVNNLSTSNIQGTNSYIKSEKADYLSGTGLLFNGSTWIGAFLSIGVSKNIYFNNINGNNVTHIGAFHCEIWLK